MGDDGEVDSNKLSRRSLHNILDALGEASLDLNVHLHVDCLSGLGIHLKTPDEDLRPVGGATNQELVLIASFVANDHGRGVDETEDL